MVGTVMHTTMAVASVEEVLAGSGKRALSTEQTSAQLGTLVGHASRTKTPVFKRIQIVFVEV